MGAATPPASPYKPTPWDTKAEQIVSGARRKYLNEGIGFDLSEQQAKQEFGLEAGFNNYQSNPYSRAALLEAEFQKANRGTMNSAGRALYGSSTSNALGANRAGYGRNRNELANAYREALGEISTGRARATQEKADSEAEAEWERISSAEEAPLEPQAAPAGKGRGRGRGGGKRNQRPAVAPSKPAGGGRGGGGGRRRKR